MSIIIRDHSLINDMYLFKGTLRFITLFLLQLKEQASFNIIIVRKKKIMYAKNSETAKLSLETKLLWNLKELHNMYACMLPFFGLVISSLNNLFHTVQLFK